jgi:hypothetical protein
VAVFLKARNQGEGSLYWTSSGKRSVKGKRPAPPARPVRALSVGAGRFEVSNKLAFDQIEDVADNLKAFVAKVRELAQAE